MNRKMRPSRALYHAPKHFTEVIKIQDVVSPAAGGAPQAVNGALTGNAIQNLRNDLHDVFEQFTVLAVKLFYLPAYNTYPLVAGTAIIPRIYMSENKARPVPPATVANMLQMDNLRILDSSKRWSMYIKRPRAWLEQYNLIQTQHTPVAPPAKQVQWLDTAPDTGAGDSGLLVQWISAIGLVEPNNSAVNITTGTLWARVYYACKEQQ